MAESPDNDIVGRTAGTAAGEATVAAARILVVDDEPQIRRFLDIGLRAQGYRVALTASGEAPAGAVFCFTRHGEEFRANAVSPTAFIPCEGMRDRESSEALAAAFAKGGVERVTRLVRGEPPPQDECWLRGAGWSLCH